MSMTAWLPSVLTRRRQLVGELRAATAARDAGRLRRLLDPEVAVVVDAGEGDRAKVRVVRGAEDAALLLAYGLGDRSGREVVERPVNGRPGLLLRRDGQPAATIAVDVTAGMISVVWVRLGATVLRRGNAVLPV
jgi:RNA polymerase sigma-70 factor (ECF subfamily)